MKGSAGVVWVKLTTYICIYKKACNFIKKETLAQVFSCKFYEIFKNTFLTEHPRTTASVFN